MKKKTIKAAIFDLDGTLLNTIGDLSAAMNKMLTSFGFDVFPLEHHIKSVGRGMKNYVLACLPEEKTTDSSFVDNATDKMKEYYFSAFNIKTTPYPGIFELLDYFKKEQISICVFTNKVHNIAVEIVKHYFNDYCFDYVCGETGEKPRKPDPTVAFEIADKLALLPEEIIFIGDSTYDILTAKNAGMISVGASWGYQDVKTLFDCSPDFLADSAYEIIDFVKNYNNK